MPRVLIVDDEKTIRASLRDIFEYEKAEVEEAENGEQAFDILNEGLFDVVFCDIKMPKMDGVELLERMDKAKMPPFVMMSGHGTIETAVDCLKKGAYDYITKPLDLNRVLVAYKNASEKNELISETQRLRKKVDARFTIIGQSKALLDVLNMVDKVAATNARVLISGPNGSGKELIARRLHAFSARSSAPFVEINCAAIPSELIESELFGHEKGAFTSAVKQKKGSFELADGGSLFLDEIGDMSLSAQAKVLRALQENKIIRVGGEKFIDVDVRLIAATNKDLKKEIEAGRFREDLFHRLNVIPIRLPALNERKEDIPELVEYFMKEISSQQGKTPIQIEDRAVKLLQSYEWKGNVRQLRNVVERLLILCEGKIKVSDIEKYAN